MIILFQVNTLAARRCKKTINKSELMLNVSKIDQYVVFIL